MNWDLSKLFAQLQDIGTIYGIKILAAIAIIIIGRIVAGIIRSLVKKGTSKSKMDSMVSAFIGNIAFAVVMVFVVVAAVNRLGVQTTSFIAIIGAAGLAIGLAFQGALANFAAGFLLIIFRPFKIGDYVEAGGVGGVIREIQIFTTTIMSVDNKLIIVPNSKITGDNIVNYTAEKRRRIDMVVGVSYGDDLDKVTGILTEIVTNFPDVLTDPTPQIAVSEMADSSVNFVVRPWSKTEDYWKVRFGLTEAIKKRLDKEGVTIPFPQRDVHIYNTN